MQIAPYRTLLYKVLSLLKPQDFILSLVLFYTMNTQSGTPYRIGQDALTQTEYEKICAACNSHEDEVLVKFTVATGMRRYDVVNVLLSNINLDTGAIMYYEKKKKRFRTIYIGTNMRQLLRKFIKTLPKDQKTLFWFREKCAYNKIQRLCEIAQIPKRPFHALRATCIKRCQRAGWSPEQVCELTGDTLRTIQLHYSVPSIAEMVEVSSVKEIV
jgi:integrase